MNSPTISVGFPVFNAGASLAAALDSLLAQDFSDFEIVLCDNASTDETATIAKGYALRDPRVRYYRNDKNIGAGPNHNLTFALSHGQYFKWTAHDITYTSSMLRRCLEAIEAPRPAAALAFPRCEMIADHSIPSWQRTATIASPDRRPHRRLTRVLQHVTMVSQLYGLIPRDILTQTRLIGSFPSSDYVLLAELAMLGELRGIPEVLVYRRMERGHGVAGLAQSGKAWRQWLNPGGRPTRVRLPRHLRLTLEYMRSALRLPLPAADRIRCLAVAASVPTWRLLLRHTKPLRKHMRMHGATAATITRNT